MTSPDTLLVPLDGSPRSDTIIATCRSLLLAADRPAVLQLVRVISPHDEPASEGAEHAPSPDGTALCLRLESARRHLDDLCLRYAGPGVAIETDVFLGDPAETILSLVEQRSPSLVAMATRARSGPLRWFMGSVADHVLRESPVPVLAIKVRDDELDVRPVSRMGKILVCLDGSERAAAVLPYASDLALNLGSELVLLRCGHPPVPVLTGAGVVPTVRPRHAEDLRAALGRSLLPLARSLGRKGLSVRSRVELGRPSDCILRAADDEDVDLIAMSTHGTRGLTRLLSGSTTSSVLERSVRPLLIVSTQGSSARSNPLRHGRAGVRVAGAGAPEQRPIARSR